MRILYGVQATGNGHITRARAMAEAFSKTDLNVDFLFTGRPREELFNMEPFGDFQVRNGLSFATEKGKVRLGQTFLNAKISRLFRDIKSLDLSGYDLVLNDFEPVSAWAAKQQGKRSIGLSHQAAFSYPIPRTGQDLGSKLVMKFFAPTQESLGVHWHHFGYPILPPIIDVHMQRQDAIAGKIMVYLPFEDLGQIRQLLKPFSHCHFYIYHPEATDNDQEHLHFRALSRVTFEENLLNCEGVIANGGFELPSESLFLGKKILVKPLVRQFEQESNALTLNQLNLASSMQTLDGEVVKEWLQRAAAEPLFYPDVAAHLAQWLEKGAQEPLAQLSESLWQQVKFPDYVTLPK